MKLISVVNPRKVQKLVQFVSQKIMPQICEVNASSTCGYILYGAISFTQTPQNLFLSHQIMDAGIYHINAFS
jgi:hypothetical protein